MKTVVFVASMAALAVAGCTTMADDGGMAAAPPAGECDASGVQGAIGQTAAANMGARLLAQTGAATLRWAPPRTAVTMDFRPDRLTVAYDDNMVIERITCG